MCLGKLLTERQLNDHIRKISHYGAHSGKKKLYDQALRDVRDSVIESPSRSTKKRSQALIIPRSYTRRYDFSRTGPPSAPQ